MRATIKMKLGATFAFIVFFLLVVVGLGVTKLSTLNDTTTQMVAGPSARLERAQSLNERVSYMLRAEKNMALTDDADLTNKFDADVMKTRGEIEALVAAGLATATEKGRPVWNDIQAAYRSYTPINDAIRDLAKRNLNAEAGRLSITKSREASLRMSALCVQLVALAKADLQAASDEAQATYENARNVMLGVAALAILIAVGGALWISRIVSTGLKKVSIAVEAVAVGDLSQDVAVTSNDEIKDLVDTVNRMTANLRQSAQLADTIAAGDLTVQHQPLSDKDTLGHALVSMVERLRGVVGDATTAAQNVAAGSQQLSSSSEQVSQGATEQAAAAEEASAS
ncbi:HAMP domain-containing protein, partial [Sphingomonas sp. NPDC019816]|uniref:HAMP domain-containing protein n=1 Tax=Sphingomonas sp. NPDC019816 TaxID=3390679 RepID=UPI003D014EAB